MRFISFIAGAVLIVTAGCRCQTIDPTPRPPVTPTTEKLTIEQGTSYGMCMGYCRRQITITQDSVVFVKKAWGRGAGQDLPDSVFTGTISPSEWNTLVAAADQASIMGLDSVIGCPDCADGGAEYVKLTRGAQTGKITFDARASVPRIQTLLDRVRAIRARFEH